MRKKICGILAILLCVAQIFWGCGGNTNTEEKLLRIHVRADSDDFRAQAVKADVVAAIQCYLKDELRCADSFAAAYRAVKSRTDTIAAIASGVLRRKGFGYGATAALTREHFPARVYGDRVVESGVYDALMVRLGTGEGDNWWCVLYPQLCYTAALAESGAVYKSLIREILAKR